MLKVGKKYYFGKILSGVANGFVGSSSWVGFIIARSMYNVMVLRIMIGKM